MMKDTYEWHAPARSATRQRSWCGPYAIATLAGVDYDTAYDRVCRVLGVQSIAGMRNNQTLKVLKDYGLRVMPLPRAEVYDIISYGDGYSTARRLTLAQWLKRRPPLPQGAMYLVQVTGHYLVVRGSRIIDNRSLQWEPFSQRRKNKRSLVSAVFEISERST